MPRPSLDAVIPWRRAQCTVAGRFDDDADEPAIQPPHACRSRGVPARATRPFRRGASSLRRSSSGCWSPWRRRLLAGRIGAVSALYGAAVVAVPGALMARGATSRLRHVSPADQRRQLHVVGMVKIGVSVADAGAGGAHRPGPVWPALLAALVRLHAVVLASRCCGAVAQTTRPNALRHSNVDQGWPQKSTPRPPVNTSFTT